MRLPVSGSDRRNHSLCRWSLAFAAQLFLYPNHLSRTTHPPSGHLCSIYPPCIGISISAWNTTTKFLSPSTTSASQIRNSPHHHRPAHFPSFAYPLISNSSFTSNVMPRHYSSSCTPAQRHAKLRQSYSGLAPFQTHGTTVLITGYSISQPLITSLHRTAESLRDESRT